MSIPKNQVRKINQPLNQPSDLFEKYFEDLQKVIMSTCARHRVFHQEAEEFISHIHFRLVDKNYAILRAYDGRSSFQTYLYTVVSRLFIDKFRSINGRWRPSKNAEKLGEVAVKFEELVHKERYTAEEAYHILTINHNLQLSREKWEKMIAHLKRTPKLHITSHDEVQDFAEETTPESVITAAIKKAAAEKIKSTLEGLIKELEEDDQLMLKMKFFSGHSIKQISIVLGRNRNYISKRLQSLLIQMKDNLLSQGFDWENVQDTLEL
ncbi:MAG: sigma-70 family RNA polymerase sigma factor [SAR324 cluster bacterium]|nr:sigma-70 family RNA polymerase sigma factor [SAR324 cluster bacterium]